VCCLQSYLLREAHVAGGRHRLPRTRVQGIRCQDHRWKRRSSPPLDSPGFALALTMDSCAYIEAGFPPQAGSPRPQPCQALAFQGTLVLPTPQDGREEEEVRPRVHCRCRCPCPRSRYCQAGRGRHRWFDRPSSPQEARTQGEHWVLQGDTRVQELMRHDVYSVPPRSGSSST
jgi:hypothetical protein